MKERRKSCFLDCSTWGPRDRGLVWRALCLVLALTVAPLPGAIFDSAGWELAAPGYQFGFPRDHGPHFSYRTEWWYFTGNVQTASGRQFGFQLTFFRHGYRPPGASDPVTSAFVLRDLKFAHFTITDVQHKAFHVAAKTSRGAFGEAGFSDGDRLVWIEDWELDYKGQFHLRASQPDFALDLQANPAQPPMLQGDRGYSQKAAGEGHASIYYSIPRLSTSGRIRIGKEEFSVQGLSWFDREWATNQLGPDQVGWNWFALELADGSDLMLYEMRLRNGGLDPFSNGRMRRPDGSEVALHREDFQLIPEKRWKSPASQADYPIGWQLRIPSQRLTAEISTPVENQELNVGVQYWEGCVRLSGQMDQHPIQGAGYMELTGYRDALTGIRSAPR